MKETIVTRFPPSPTGYLHVGGARTALFNWLYARHTKGKFILRIEDTDTQRSTQESVDAIFEALTWLGIDWDEGPYFQSQRTSVYQEYVKKLLNSNGAYYCTCSSERLENMRKQQMEMGLKPKYDGMCREKGLQESQNAVVRFKAPATGTTIVEDIIKGNIAFQNTELDDFVIQRSDRTFTYNFCVVVDDISMGINTIIRGDDHVNNTPKQIQLYKALEVPLPAFGHVPMVLGKDKTRLSKRHGAMSVTAYRDMGYLPDALINYLVRLGWSHGDQEFFVRDELIEKFTLDHIGHSAGVFDPDKLLALNAQHIQAASPAKVIPHLKPFLKEKGCDVSDTTYLEAIIPTLNKRSKTLIDMADGAMFYFMDSISYEESAAKKFLTPKALPAMNLLIEKIQALDALTEKNLEDIFTAVLEATGEKLKAIAQPIRIALTGKTASPGIFEIIEVLGKDRVLSRLNAAVAYIGNSAV